mgnify:CR=1 FL=1
MKRLEELNLSTLEYRRQRFDMIILYKMLNNKFDFDYKNVNLLLVMRICQIVQYQISCINIFPWQPSNNKSMVT